MMSVVAGACDTKVSQCNRLTDTVNRHTQQLKTSLEALASDDATTATGAHYQDTLASAREEIRGLTFSDAQLQTYADRYLELLDEANHLGTLLLDEQADETQRTKTMNSAKQLVKLEAGLVNDVNEYCGTSP